MADLIIIAIIAVIVGAAVRYIVKAKKSGAKCIGCPVEGCSSKNSNTGCSCGCGGSEESGNEK